MELQSLKLFVTDEDIVKLADPLLKEQESIEDLKIHLMPEGVTVQGQYPTGFGFKVPFETLWEVTGAGSAVLIRLSQVKVAGLPGGMIRGVLMRLIRDQVANNPGISVSEETIRVDVPAMMKPHGADLRVNYIAVRMSIGAAVIEAGCESYGE